MSNGAFLTSQLPVTTNAVPSDRVLILWNAIANGSLTPNSPQTMMITISDIVNNALSTIETDIMTSGTLSFGNSSVNTVVNSVSIVVQNSTATIFSVNTAGVINGNGAGLTSVSAPGDGGANTYILYNKSGITGGDANLTWTGSLLTIGNSSINTTANSTTLLNGQTAINSTVIAVGNNGSVLVGNGTYNVVISPQSLTLSNNGVLEWSVTGAGAASILTSYTIGNSTVNTFIAPTVIDVGVSSPTQVGAALSNQSLIISNSSVLAQVNVTNFSVGNTTSNSNLGSGSLAIGNSTVNATMNATTIRVVNLFQMQGLGGI